MKSYKHTPQVVSRSLLILLIFVAIHFGGEARSYAQEISVSHTQPVDNVISKMQLIDIADFVISAPSMREMVVTQAKAQVKRLPPENLNGAWYFGKLKNTTDQMGAWRLQTELLVPGSLTGFVGDTDSVQKIMHFNYAGLLGLHEVSQGPVLASELLYIKPGDELGLWIYVEKGGFLSSYPLRLIPDQLYAKQVKSDLLWQGLYSGAACLFIIYFITYSNLLASRASAYYACFFTFLVLLNLHSYGLFSQNFIFFQAHHFTVFTPLHLGVLLSYTAFALDFLHLPKRQPKLTRGIIIYTAVFFSIQLMNALLDTLITKALMLPGYLGVFSVMLWTIYIAVKDKIPGAMIFMAGSTIFFLSTVLVGVMPVFGNLHVNILVDRTTLLSQLLIAFTFAAAIVRQTSVLRQERDKSLSAGLVLTQQNLSLNHVLSNTKADLETARAESNAHRNRLLATQHDLRQPLKTFELALSNTMESDINTLAKLHAGLDYMQRVLEARCEDDEVLLEAEHSSIARNVSTQEAVPIQVIFDNLHRMYVDDAAAKGLSFTLVSTSLIVQADSIALIRILSNLVSNAIKFTASGRVLIGVRRKASTFTIEVWDTGPGISSDNQHRIFEHFERGATADAVEGQGLGLAIAKKLATEQALTITLSSWLGRGSVFALTGLKASSAV